MMIPGGPGFSAAVSRKKSEDKMAVEFYGAGQSLDEAVISKAEAKLGFALPRELREFLLATNGGVPDPAQFNIAWTPEQPFGKHWKTSEVSRFHSIGAPGFADLVEENTVTFEGRIPASTVAFASDPAGNQLLLAIGGPFAGKILFWLMDEEVEEGMTPSYDDCGIVADSFAGFLDGLY
jgi:cell wall assembly regulator SMI1